MTYIGEQKAHAIATFVDAVPDGFLVDVDRVGNEPMDRAARIYCWERGDKIGADDYVVEVEVRVVRVIGRGPHAAERAEQGSTGDRTNVEFDYE